MFMETTAEHRNNRIVNHMNIPHQRTERRCSYCRQPGHTITRCNSDRIREFELICAETARNINVPDDFKKWLSDNYMNNQSLLKTFVIRRMGYTNRIRIPNCIDLIADYIYRKYRPEMFNHGNRNLNNDESSENTNIDDDDDNAHFENEFINFLVQLRNNLSIYREQLSQDQHVQNMRNMERTLIQELFTSFLHNFNNGHRIGEINNGTRKFNINSMIDISDENDTNENTRCNICWDEKENAQFIKFGCNHEFCKECVITSFRGEQRQHPCCALCRSAVMTMTCKTVETHTELAEFIV
jgi:hypothetical protein